MENTKDQAGMDETVNAGKLIRQMQDFMAHCYALMQQGQEPDLTGLDDQVELLCHGIATMNEEESARLRPKLDTLVEELTALGNQLQAQKDDLSRQLGALNNQKQAHNAYQRATASVPGVSSSAGERDNEE